MSFATQHGSQDDDDFGPGAALVLSLFAMFLLVAAMSWRDVFERKSDLPTTLVDMSEKSRGQGLFDVGQSVLSQEAKRIVAQVARQAVENAKARAQRRQRGANHLQIIGYASPEGGRNQQLAGDRAIAVRNYLVNGLAVPDECVVVASYSDSHSRLLQDWIKKGHSLAEFRQVGGADAQKRVLAVSDAELAKERRVTILAVFHSDSTCRLDQIKLAGG